MDHWLDVYRKLVQSYAVVGKVNIDLGRYDSRPLLVKNALIPISVG